MHTHARTHALTFSLTTGALYPTHHPQGGLDAGFQGPCVLLLALEPGVFVVAREVPLLFVLVVVVAVVLLLLLLCVAACGGRR